jgi:hypothetical protein
MKTLLESVNDLAGEYITMPLERFFLFTTIGLLIMLIVITLAAPLSSAKYMTMLVLYFTLMTTALLSHANYQINSIVEAVDNDVEANTDEDFMV